MTSTARVLSQDTARKPTPGDTYRHTQSPPLESLNTAEKLIINKHKTGPWQWNLLASFLYLFIYLLLLQYSSFCSFTIKDSSSSFVLLPICSKHRFPYFLLAWFTLLRISPAFGSIYSLKIFLSFHLFIEIKLFPLCFFAVVGWPALIGFLLAPKKKSLSTLFRWLFFCVGANFSSFAYSTTNASSPWIIIHHFCLCAADGCVNFLYIGK